MDQSRPAASSSPAGNSRTVECVASECGRCRRYSRRRRRSNGAAIRPWDADSDGEDRNGGIAIRAPRRRGHPVAEWRDRRCHPWIDTLRRRLLPSRQPQPESFEPVGGRRKSNLGEVDHARATEGWGCAIRAGAGTVNLGARTGTLASVERRGEEQGNPVGAPPFIAACQPSPHDRFPGGVRWRNPCLRDPSGSGCGICF